MGEVKSCSIHFLREFFIRSAEVRRTSQTLNAAKKMLEVIDASLYDITDLQKSVDMMEEDLRKTQIWMREKQFYVEQLIEAINSVEARSYARLHYLNGLQWCEVAQLSGLNEDAVKKRVYRELQKSNFTIEGGLS